MPTRLLWNSLQPFASCGAGPHHASSKAFEGKKCRWYCWREYGLETDLASFCVARKEVTVALRRLHLIMNFSFMVGLWELIDYSNWSRAIDLDETGHWIDYGYDAALPLIYCSPLCSYYHHSVSSISNVSNGAAWPHFRASLRLLESSGQKYWMPQFTIAR